MKEEYNIKFAVEIYDQEELERFRSDKIELVALLRNMAKWIQQGSYIELYCKDLELDEPKGFIS